MIPRPSLLLCLCLPALVGCASLHRRSSQERKAEAAKIAAAARPLQSVGKITVVNVQDAFVLIDSSGRPTPPAGARLRSYTGPVESAELKTSDVQRRQLSVADIVSGTPLQGDEVFLRGEPPVARAVAPVPR